MGIEYDQTKETWENVYKMMYKKGSKIYKYYDIENYKIKFNRNSAFLRNTEIDQKIKKFFENSNDDEIENKKTFTRISGETDFNFRVLYNAYKNNPNVRFETKKRIEYYLNNKIYAKENFSLMLCAGGEHGSLQNLKGENNKYNDNNIKDHFNVYDDICAYINKLNENFYLNENNTVNSKLLDKVSNTNKEYIVIQKEAICLYLNLFGDIYDYCKEIYRINDELVNRMLCFANKKDYDDLDKEINDYLDISDEFFKQKSENLKV